MLHETRASARWNISSGSRAAVATTLAARPVYPRLLTTLLYRPIVQPWATTGLKRVAGPGLPSRMVWQVRGRTR